MLNACQISFQFLKVTFEHIQSFLKIGKPTCQDLTVFLDVKDSIIFKVSSFGCKCEPQMIIKEKKLLHLIWLCYTISCEKLLAQSLQSRCNNNGKCCCCSVFISDFEPFIDNIFLTSKFSLKNNRSKADSYICRNKEQC